MGKLGERVGRGALDVVFDAEDDGNGRSGVRSTAKSWE